VPITQQLPLDRCENKRKIRIRKMSRNDSNKRDGFDENMSVWKLNDGKYDELQMASGKKPAKSKKTPEYVKECKADFEKGFDIMGKMAGDDKLKKTLSENAIKCAGEIQNPKAEMDLGKEIDRICSNLRKDDYEELKRNAIALQAVQAMINKISDIEENNKTNPVAMKLLVSKKEGLEKQADIYRKRLKTVKDKYPQLFPTRFPGSCNKAINDVF